MKTLIVLLVCCVLSAACVGQSEEKNVWNEKFNSTGAVLTLKELGRSRVNGQTMVTYHAFATGLPKDVEYTLWAKLVGGEPQSPVVAYINKDGLIVNVLADSAHGVAEDPIDLQVFAGRGEPKDFALISDDSRYRAFARVVPFPIEDLVGPCKLAATMSGRNYLSVTIVVTGLQPEEEIEVQRRSGNEVGVEKSTAGKTGTWVAAFFPSVKGQVSGQLRVLVKAKECAVRVEIPWGQGSYVIQ